MADTSRKIGWIGIGRMGYAMAERIAKGGADITVWNRTRSKAEPLAAAGAKVADSLVELGACDVVFVMVSTWDDVRQVVAGPGGLLSGDKTPKLVVECSSISVEAIRTSVRRPTSRRRCRPRRAAPTRTATRRSQGSER